MDIETELPIDPTEPDPALATVVTVEGNHTDEDAGDSPAQAPAQPHPPFPSPAAPSSKISPRKLAANRANARKSTGPRTAKGKRRVSLNGYLHRPARPSVRLLGLAEARTLRQEPGSAERLYQELIAPYEPAPALLRMHFQDLARLHLELEAWERIRDAQLEHRWQQNDVERRRRYQEMERDLAATAQQQLERGLCQVDDSPAKFKRMAEYFVLLKQHLQRRNFNVSNILSMLYGQKVEPRHDRAQTICIGCQKLMSGKVPDPPRRDLELLIGLIEEEYREAMRTYLLKLDENTMTRFACLAGLGVNTIADQRMQRQGQWLRQAIDRKQKVITDLLKVLRPGPLGARAVTDADGEDPRNFANFEGSKPTNNSESSSSAERLGKSNPPKATRGRRSRR